MKILIVEDEKRLAEMMKLGLARQGYAVDVIHESQKAQQRIQLSANEYDLIVLDLMMPNKGGLEICREIRRQQILTPLLVVTANRSVESKVTLLDSGADDYLTKPFAFEEFLGRVRAVTRRPRQTLATKLQTNDLVLDTVTQTVTRAGRPIKFTLREFRILEYLMRNPNTVLSREDIITNIWDFEYDAFSNIVDVFIKKIRDKIDRHHPQQLIETIRGVGYRLKS